MTSIHRVLYSVDRLTRVNQNLAFVLNFKNLNHKMCVSRPLVRHCTHGATVPPSALLIDHQFIVVLLCLKYVDRLPSTSINCVGLFLCSLKYFPFRYMAATTTIKYFSRNNKEMWMGKMVDIYGIICRQSVAGPIVIALFCVIRKHLSKLVIKYSLIKTTHKYRSLS